MRGAKCVYVDNFSAQSGPFFWKPVHFQSQRSFSWFLAKRSRKSVYLSAALKSTDIRRPGWQNIQRYDTALSSWVKCVKAIDTILFWSSGIISLPVSPECFTIYLKPTFCCAFRRSHWLPLVSLIIITFISIARIPLYSFQMRFTMIK